MTESAEPHRVEHRAQHAYQVIATPEQVWQAIATAEGISAWMVPTHLDPRVGGKVSFDLGDLTSTGVITDYTPHARFAYEEPWPLADRAEDFPQQMVEWFDSIGVSLAQVHEDLSHTTPIATEFLIEATSGGTCVIRVVTSAYGTGAEWENEFFTEMIAGTVPMWDRLAALFDAARPR